MVFITFTHSLSLCINVVSIIVINFIVDTFYSLFRAVKIYILFIKNIYWFFSLVQ